MNRIAHKPAALVVESIMNASNHRTENDVKVGRTNVTSDGETMMLDVTSENTCNNRLTELILYKHNAEKKIAELERINTKLKEQLQLHSNNNSGSSNNSNKNMKKLKSNVDSNDNEGGNCDDTGSDSTCNAEINERLSSSPETRHGNVKVGTLEHITEWNKELVETVHKLERALLVMEAESKAQLIVMNDQMSSVMSENAQMREANDQLKARVADDVLRQRQTNRIEMAFEKAKIATQVRRAGLARLESLERNLLEAHDDLFYTTRCDALFGPQRDVTFVFHYIANLSSLHSDGEEFVMNVCQELLRNICRRFGGYYIIKNLDGVFVYAFQSAAIALYFAQECHEQIVRLAWPDRIEAIPSFRSIYENEEVESEGRKDANDGSKSIGDIVNNKDHMCNNSMLEDSSTDTDNTDDNEDGNEEEEAEAEEEKGKNDANEKSHTTITVSNINQQESVLEKPNANDKYTFEANSKKHAKTLETVSMNTNNNNNTNDNKRKMKKKIGKRCKVKQGRLGKSKVLVNNKTCLFKGPRLHTCLYACNPESEIDPVTGRCLFYGQALRTAITAALEQSSVGECVVNRE